MTEPWNYLQNGKTQGPVTEEELQQLIDTGTLPFDGLVWHPGLPDWIKASEAPELVAPVPGIAAAPAPAPAPEDRSPFEAPKAIVYPVAEPSSLEAQAAVAGALEALRATRPWARFLGVLGAIGIGLMVLFSILMATLDQGPFKGLPTPVRILAPILYILFGAFQVPPVIYLNRYASRIGTLLKSQAPEDLARALDAQKTFWRYVGIFALVVTSIYALVILLAGGVAVVASLVRRF